jgi:hypothetical protein
LSSTAAIRRFEGRSFCGHGSRRRGACHRAALCADPLAPPHHEDLILRSAPLRASRRMRHTRTSAFSRQHAPEVLQISSAPKKEEGAGKTGCALHPRPRVQRVVKKAHTSIQVQRKHSGLPCAMVLRLIPCSPRRDLACLSPSLPRSLLPRNLTPAIGASGPHDFAVRVTRRSSKALSRPPLPVPRQ